MLAMLEQLLEKILLSGFARQISSHRYWFAFALLLGILLAGLNPASRDYILQHPGLLGHVMTGMLLGALFIYSTRLHGKAQLALNGTYWAANEIIKHIRNDGAQKALLEVTAKRLIHKNLDGEVTRTYKIKAVGPVHVWTVGLGVSQGAAPAATLGDVDFRITVDKDKIAYVQAENSPRRKEVAIFFLPFMRDGDVRTITIHYRWAGMYATLASRPWDRLIGTAREERFTYKLAGQSTDPIPTARFEILAAPELSELEARMPGSPRAALTEDLSGPWRVWRLTATDATDDFEVVVKRKKRRK